MHGAARRGICTTNRTSGFFMLRRGVYFEVGSDKMRLKRRFASRAAQSAARMGI